MKGTAHLIRLALGIIFTGLLFVAAQPALAASQCADKDSSRWTADTAAEARICLGELEGLAVKECDRALCAAVETWRLKPEAQRLPETSPLLAKIRDELESKVLPAHKEAQPLLNELARWLKDLARATPEDMRNSTSGPFHSEAARPWRYVRTKHKILENQKNEVDLYTKLELGCTTAEACTRELRGSADIVVYSVMIETVANSLLTELRQQSAAYIDMLDKRWGNYLGSSRFQWPWELAINSRRLRTTEAGFVSPPEDQLIFLHPSPGLRYNSRTDNKFEPTLVLELIGKYRWTWQGTEQKDFRGASLIMTWTNEPGERKPGLGAMMHFQKNYSIGLTHHSTANGKRTSLMLSVDLGKLFEDKDFVKNKLKGLLD